MIGLWGTHRLIYNVTENEQTAFIGTLLTLANPIYLGLSASFMTDVHFYAPMVWALAYMVIGLKWDSVRLMLIGIGIATLALLVRQFGIALFAGFGIAYIARKGIQLKSLVIAGICVILGLSLQVGYQRWLSYMMPGTVSYNVQATNFFHLSYYKPQLFYGFINNMFVGLMYTGLFMFPYFLTLLTKKNLVELRNNRWLWLLSAAIIVGLWQTVFGGISMPIWFNTLTAFGIGPILLRDVYYRMYDMPVPDVLRFIMMGVTICSLLGSICILYYLIKISQYLLRASTDHKQRTVGLLLFSIIGIYFLPIGLQVIFDRYLLPMPVLLLCLVGLIQSVTYQKTAERILPIPLYLSIGLLVLYLSFSVIATHDYLALNRTRWQALNSMLQQGIQPDEIDGGLEFNGWYLYSASYKPTPDKSWWWVHNDTYVAGASVLPGYMLYKKQKVNTWFPWGIQQIAIGKKSQSGRITRLNNPYSTN
ncbi:hypothetical protein [Spirosoma sp.]|uniref:hypothetical protein n=1 Tax=Spirosoma sp. TaxID=1899569 RepID=UPI003B3A62A4